MSVKQAVGRSAAARAAKQDYQCGLAISCRVRLESHAAKCVGRRRPKNPLVWDCRDLFHSRRCGGMDTLLGCRVPQELPHEAQDSTLGCSDRTGGPTRFLGPSARSKSASRRMNASCCGQHCGKWGQTGYGVQVGALSFPVSNAIQQRRARNISGGHTATHDKRRHFETRSSIASHAPSGCMSHVPRG